MSRAWTPEEFKQELLKLGSKYHIHHPYHIAMNSGKLSREQVQLWVANRYYYQITIPRKDAAILSNCPDQHFRQRWLQRIIDHDGVDVGAGGIEAWLSLAEAVGLSREKTQDLSLLLPGVKFAVDAYFNFARTAPWQEAVCSSLTELFAPEIHQVRLQNWPSAYPWIDPAGFQYFQNRLQQARNDVIHGLEVTLAYFNTPSLQLRALEIVSFKCDVLWSMLDAMEAHDEHL